MRKSVCSSRIRRLAYFERLRDEAFDGFVSYGIFALVIPIGGFIVWHLIIDAIIVFYIAIILGVLFATGAVISWIQLKTLDAEIGQFFGDQTEQSDSDAE